jgi:hypothetical protein
VPAARSLRPWLLAALRRHRDPRAACLVRAVAICLLLLAVAPCTNPFATPLGTLAYAVSAVDASTRVKDGVDLPLLTALPSAVVVLDDVRVESVRLRPRPVVYGWRGAQPDAHAVLRL